MQSDTPRPGEDPLPPIGDPPTEPPAPQPPGPISAS